MGLDMLGIQFLYFTSWPPDQQSPFLWPFHLHSPLEHIQVSSTIPWMVLRSSRWRQTLTSKRNCWTLRTTPHVTSRERFLGPQFSQAKKPAKNMNLQELLWILQQQPVYMSRLSEILRKNSVQEMELDFGVDVFLGWEQWLRPCSFLYALKCHEGCGGKRTWHMRNWRVGSSFRYIYIYICIYMLHTQGEYENSTASFFPLCQDTEHHIFRQMCKRIYHDLLEPRVWLSFVR